LFPIVALYVMTFLPFSSNRQSQLAHAKLPV
jgi:hypothetical protein